MNGKRSFEEADDVVADVADRTPDEMWNVGWRDELKARERLLKLLQWVAFAPGAVKNDEWSEPEKEKPPDLVGGVGGVEKKTGRAVVDLGESRDRRFHVRDKIDNQRDEIAAFREFTELIACRRNRMFEF